MTMPRSNVVPGEVVLVPRIMLMTDGTGTGSQWAFAGSFAEDNGCKVVPCLVVGAKDISSTWYRKTEVILPDGRTAFYVVASCGEDRSHVMITLEEDERREKARR